MLTVPAPIPANEEARLAALAEYHLIDTPAEAEFDRLVGLASRLFDVPIVLISLIERDRQFFKARVGLDVCETSRDVSFCAHAILQDDILFIPDATNDPRFASNPLVLGPPFIRFYAGKTLVAPTGEKVGTICLIDTRPRKEFGSGDRRNLSDLAALVMDRMEMRRLDFAKNVSQSRFENIAATSPDAIICCSVGGRITFWNRSAERVFGYSADEIIGQPGSVIVPPGWRGTYEAELERFRNGDKMEMADKTTELSGLRKDGSEFPADFSLSTWQEGQTTSIGAIVRDVSERRENEERLFWLASRDSLTGLPNRAAWRDCLAKTVAAGGPATIMILDLDGFKEVNDSFGHSAGDALLKGVAARLNAACEDAIMVARLGGDEFVALLNGDRMQAAATSAQRLVDAVSQPLIAGGQTIQVGASVGVALSPVHGDTPEDLLGAADLALYKAKAAGRGRFEIFTPALRDVAVARRALQKELLQAFQQGEFELY